MDPPCFTFSLPSLNTHLHYYYYYYLCVLILSSLASIWFHSLPLASNTYHQVNPIPCTPIPHAQAMKQSSKHCCLVSQPQPFCNGPSVLPSTQLLPGPHLPWLLITPTHCSSLFEPPAPFPSFLTVDDLASPLWQDKSNYVGAFTSNRHCDCLVHPTFLPVIWGTFPLSVEASPSTWSQSYSSLLHNLFFTFRCIIPFRFWHAAISLLMKTLSEPHISMAPFLFHCFL